MLKTKIQSFVFLPIIIIFLLTGCARQDRKILNNFENRPFDVEQEKEDVKIGLKFLSKKEFNAIFKSPSFLNRQSVPKNYHSIQINISNKNNKEYLIDKNSINLNLIPHNKMNKKLKKNTIAPALLSFPFFGYLISAVTFMTTGLIMIATHADGMCPCALLIVPSTIAIPAGIIGGITCAILFGRSIHKKNKRLRRKLQNQVFDPSKETAVKENNIFETMIFVSKKDLKDKFSIFLFNPLTKEIELEFLLPCAIQPCKK